MTNQLNSHRKSYPKLKRHGRWLIYVAIMLVALVLVHEALRPWYMNWGATEEEVQRVLPGDQLAPESPNIATHAITIQAPPEKVWPWIAQIGRDRAGWYSYTWIEDLCLSDTTDADRIHPEWQARHAGDNIWLTPPYRYHGNMRFVVYAYEPGHVMELVYPGEDEELAHRGPPIDNTWTFDLDPQGANASRLIMRSRNRATGLVMRAFIYFIFEPAHFIMERKMLLTLKQLVERSTSQP